MLYATNEHEDKVLAKYASDRAECRYSGKPISPISLDGLMCWRPHTSDPWLYPENRWSLAWRSHFPKAWVEEVLERGREKHVADVLLPNKVVLKFQTRGLTNSQIVQRESYFSHRMIWVIDARKWDFIFSPMLGKAPSTDKHYQWCQYKGVHRQHTWQNARCPIFLDMGDDQLYWLNWQLRTSLKMTYNPLEGLVKAYTKEAFLKKYTSAR